MYIGSLTRLIRRCRVAAIKVSWEVRQVRYEHRVIPVAVSFDG